MTIAASVHIANSFQKALDGLLGFLPNLLGFLLILIVGYFIARLVKGILTKVLEKVGVDKALHSGPAGSVCRPGQSGGQPRRADRGRRVLVHLSVRSHGGDQRA